MYNNRLQERNVFTEILGIDKPDSPTKVINIISIINNYNADSDKTIPGAVRAKMAGGLFTSFIDAAMREAKIKKLSDGSFFAKIPSCPGVWADGDNESECLATLQEVLEEWLLFKLRDGDPIPVVGNVNLNIQWKEDLSWVGEDIETNQPERAN